MMRPDYCPLSQEPCQAMCVLSDVRCKIRDTAPQPAQQKPLTVEQIRELPSPSYGILNFVRAVERAHGIGGES